MSHARFTAEVLVAMYKGDNQSCIYVQDVGGNGDMSVTNDAEYVVATVTKEFGMLPIMYKDSMGLIDELHHRNGVHRGFRTLGGTRNQEEAFLVLAGRHYANDDKTCQ